MAQSQPITGSGVTDLHVWQVLTRMHTHTCTCTQKGGNPISRHFVVGWHSNSLIECMRLCKGHTGASPYKQITTPSDRHTHTHTLIGVHTMDTQREAQTVKEHNRMKEKQRITCNKIHLRREKWTGKKNSSQLWQQSQEKGQEDKSEKHEKTIKSLSLSHIHTHTHAVSHTVATVKKTTSCRDRWSLSNRQETKNMVAFPLRQNACTWACTHTHTHARTHARTRTRTRKHTHVDNPPARLINLYKATFLNLLHYSFVSVASAG